MPDQSWGGGIVFPAAVLVIAALGGAYALWSPAVQQREALTLREERLAAEVSDLWERSVELERTRDALMYDPLMIESVARAQLGYRRPGERVYPPAERLAPPRSPRQGDPASAFAPKALPDRSPQEELLSTLAGLLMPSMALLAVGALLYWLIADGESVSPSQSEAETSET